MKKNTLLRTIFLLTLISCQSQDSLTNELGYSTESLKTINQLSDKNECLQAQLNYLKAVVRRQDEQKIEMQYELDQKGRMYLIARSKYFRIIDEQRLLQKNLITQK